MLPHEREEYRQTMGHVWLGFSEKQMTAWLHAAGFKDVSLACYAAGVEGKRTFFIRRDRAAKQVEY